MKCVNGVWYYGGRSYATLYEALVAVWPPGPPRRADGKRVAPGIRSTKSGRVKQVMAKHCFCL